jgi:hypothetical protein
MLSDDTKRPTYHNGQYLTPDDFIAEDRYHTDLRHRLSLGQHAWGIFSGLELNEVAREGSSTSVDVFVSPGLAIDGFGREIVVFAPFQLDASLFLQPTLPAGWIPVWIRYYTESTDPPRYGYELCDDPDLATRTRETFTVEVGERSKPFGDVVIGGAAIPEASLDVVDGSIPYQALPEDADDDRWLVPLGYVNWDGTSSFVKSSSAADNEQRVKGRVYGGEVSAHTYPPDDNWELATRHVATAGTDPPRAHGFVRGDLTVEDYLVVKALGKADQGIELWASPLSFLDKDGKDQGRPLVVSRDDQVAGADLHVKIGNDSARKNRLVVDASKPERLVVYDSGDVDVAGDLAVKGIVDLSSATDDRIVLGGTPATDDTAAIGTENGGDVLYERAKNGLRWYVGKKPDAGTSARMWLDGSQLSIRGDALIGAGADGRLKVRRIDGKDWQSDSDDDLFLNWDSGKNVQIGRPGVKSDLIVHGDIFLGPTKLPVAIDVQVGRWFVGLQGTGSVPVIKVVPVTVHTPLTTVNQGRLVAFLADIHNVNVATDARWSAAWDQIQPTDMGGGNWQFNVVCAVGDSDGFLDYIGFVAVFT